MIGGTYELGRRLGQGGIGTVYEGRHTITNKPVAIKLISSDVTDTSPTARARFLREVQAAALIKHSGVPTVFDAGISPDGTLYLVMELLRGEDLSEKLAKGKVPVRELVSWMIQVLDILSRAHEAGVIHRDIKPSNIFITHGADGPAIKLLDFGTIKHLNRSSWQGLTHEDALIGTPAYMSPEQVLSQEASEQSDIWGVGAVMFRGLFGQSLVAGTGALDVLRNLAQHKFTPFPAEHAVPESVLKIVKRALSVDPQQRWASAKHMQAALRESLPSVPDTVELPMALPATLMTSPSVSSTGFDTVSSWIRGEQRKRAGFAATALLGALLAIFFIGRVDVNESAVTSAHASKAALPTERVTDTPSVPSKTSMMATTMPLNPAAPTPSPEAPAPIFAPSLEEASPKPRVKESRRRRRRRRKIRKSSKTSPAARRSSVSLIKDYD